MSATQPTTYRIYLRDPSNVLALPFEVNLASDKAARIRADARQGICLSVRGDLGARAVGLHSTQGRVGAYPRWPGERR